MSTLCENGKVKTSESDLLFKGALYCSPERQESWQNDVLALFKDISSSPKPSQKNEIDNEVLSFVVKMLQVISENEDWKKIRQFYFGSNLLNYYEEKVVTGILLYSSEGIRIIENLYEDNMPIDVDCIYSQAKKGDTLNSELDKQSNRKRKNLIARGKLYCKKGSFLSWKKDVNEIFDEIVRMGNEGIPQHKLEIHKNALGYLKMIHEKESWNEIRDAIERQNFFPGDFTDILELVIEYSPYGLETIGKIYGDNIPNHAKLAYEIKRRNGNQYVEDAEEVIEMIQKNKAKFNKWSLVPKKAKGYLLDADDYCEGVGSWRFAYQGAKIADESILSTTLAGYIIVCANKIVDNNARKDTLSKLISTAVNYGCEKETLLLVSHACPLIFEDMVDDYYGRSVPRWAFAGCFESDLRSKRLDTLELKIKLDENIRAMYGCRDSVESSKKWVEQTKHAFGKINSAYLNGILSEDKLDRTIIMKYAGIIMNAMEKGESIVDIQKYIKGACEEVRTLSEKETTFILNKYILYYAKPWAKTTFIEAQYGTKIPFALQSSYFDKKIAEYDREVHLEDYLKAESFTRRVSSKYPQNRITTMESYFNTLAKYNRFCLEDRRESWLNKAIELATNARNGDFDINTAKVLELSGRTMKYLSQVGTTLGDAVEFINKIEEDSAIKENALSCLVTYYDPKANLAKRYYGEMIPNSVVAAISARKELDKQPKDLKSKIKNFFSKKKK